MGGLLSFDYKLPNVPRSVSILSASAVLKTTYRSYSLENLDQPLGTEVITTPLFVLGGEDEELGRNTCVSATDARGVALNTRCSITTTTTTSRRRRRNARSTAAPCAIQVIPASGSFQVSHPSIPHPTPSLSIDQLIDTRLILSLSSSPTSLAYRPMKRSVHPLCQGPERPSTSTMN